MIVCILKEQAELLLDMDFFEVDMSYKRIGKSDLNDVVFATFLHNHGKSMYIWKFLRPNASGIMLPVITLCRVFTEQEYLAGYCRLFKKTVSKLTGKQVKFRHIHGGGVNALGLDMCNRQIKG
jgi:hypothetical protein